MKQYSCTPFAVVISSGTVDSHAQIDTLELQLYLVMLSMQLSCVLVCMPALTYLPSPVQ